MKVRGEVVDILNHGTIVQILVETKEGIRVIAVDHRPFEWIMENYGDIKGRLVSYDGEYLDFSD